MGLEYITAYLLLGGNLGDREANLKLALNFLENEVGEIISRSSIYETAAWGKTDQPAFLNQAIGIKTKLSALDLLDKVLAIEQKLGRVRLEKWGERLIDIDIILYGNEIVDFAEKLHVPHPYMQNRRFVMEPLAEIAPHIIHPVFKKTILEISKEINDDLTVAKF